MRTMAKCEESVVLGPGQRDVGTFSWHAVRVEHLQLSSATAEDDDRLAH